MPLDGCRQEISHAVRCRCSCTRTDIVLLRTGDANQSTHTDTDGFSNDRVVHMWGGSERQRKRRWNDCLWIVLHGSTWCPGAEFKSIMAVAASMSDSGRGENMHDVSPKVRKHGSVTSLLGLGLGSGSYCFKKEHPSTSQYLDWICRGFVQTNRRIQSSRGYWERIWSFQTWQSV